MQNPPSGQQGYGTPYSTPPPSAPLAVPPKGAKDKTSLGLDANLGAAIGYIVGLLALIMIFIEKENRFARFHAMQSLLVSVSAVVLFIALMIVVSILSFISSYLGLLAFLGPLIWLVYFVALLFCAYKAYQGETFKLPVIGNIAENFAGK